VKDGDALVREFRKAVWLLHVLVTIEYVLDTRAGVLEAWLAGRRN